VTLGIPVFALLLASSAWAGQALEDAQSRRSKAFNDFYTGYMNSSQQPSDAQAIGASTIGPATDATVRALNQEKISAFKQAGFQIMTQEQADAAHAKARAKAEAEAAEKAEADGDGDSAADGSGDGAGKKEASGEKDSHPAAIARKPAAPETVLDGSKIPSKIIFGKPADANK